MKKRTSRLFSLLLSFVMVLGMLPATTPHVHAADVPIPVTPQGSTYSLFTEENLEDQYGTTFLYVVERDGRYYTLARPSVSPFAEVDSIAAVDITQYRDPETNTFSGIPESANVGVMQYQSYILPEYGTSALFFPGEIMLNLSVPFEDSGETWFEGGIRYYDRHDTYSYSRALWEATGDGSGYLYDRYSDWSGDGGTVYGVLALKGTDRFALRNFSEEFEAETPISVNAYLYAAPCSHPSPEHSEYDAPTCMDKGCEEYWYCILCNNYFADEACLAVIGHKPVLPALDHSYDSESCINCGQPVPIYTRITSYEQFRTLDPNASFIAVAEIDDGSGGKEFYVLKKEIGTADADIDEDGSPDILLIDENHNSVADILEVDFNDDGIADAMDFDGIHTGEPDGILDDEEILEYLFHLEFEYNDGYIAALRTIGAIPVTPADDGTISVKNMGALEWIMERAIPDSQLAEQYYGDGATKKDYENDFRFRIPNFWIRPVVSVSNNYYLQPYEQGDSKWWGVLFGDDVKELNEYLYDFTFEETYPDEAAVLYTESFHNRNQEGQLAHALRFWINGEKKTFIMTSDSFWEELEGTQYPIYLYCSDAGDEVHEHIWGNWTPAFEEIHKRICTVEGCSEYELEAHTPGEECTPDPENYELGHWVTCTECGGQFHEYHTIEKVPGNSRYDYWRDTGDGIHHVVNCTQCHGPVEYAKHSWSDWYNGNMEIDGEWVRGHYRRCNKYPCDANEWQAGCIYDEGVVTTEPTCTQPGVMTYTCTSDPACELETKSYTKEIPALDHDWGEWAAMDGNPTMEQRVCRRDPSHTEERSAHEHDWGRWVTDGADNHKRTCTVEGCTIVTQTEAHVWGDWVITTPPTCVAEGVRTATCAVCNDTKTMSIPALTDAHDFGSWESISETQHSRFCQNEGCTAAQTADHEIESTVIQIETCEVDGQEYAHCTVCEYENYTPRPALGHEWGDWAYDSVDSHIRSCQREFCDAVDYGGHEWGRWVCVDESIHKMTCDICGGYQTEEHNWDNGTVTKEPTEWESGIKTYTCGTCAHTRTEAIDQLVHECIFTDWYPNGDENHKRDCMDDRCDKFETLPHEWDEGVITAEPTCKEVGIKTYTCQVCQHTRTVDIPMFTEHTWSEWVINKVDEANSHIRFCACGESQTEPHSFTNYESDGNATSESDGTKTAKCDHCDATDTIIDEGSMLTHIPGKWKVIMKATCVEPGLETSSCELCGEKLERIIEPHGKEIVEIDGIPATCTENGKTAKTVCSECGKVIQKQKTIKKLGHSLAVLRFDETGHWYACDRDGCDGMGKVSAHKYDVDSCEKAAVCEDCGYEKPSGEHIPGKWKVTRKATCTENGEQSAACTICKTKITVEIEAHGNEVVEIEEIPATCTENGKTAKTVCSECGKVVQKQKTIKKLGHSLTDLCFDETGHWYVCDRDGCDGMGKVSAHKYDVDSCAENALCEVCGYEKPSGEHIPGKWKVTRKATCIEDGLQTSTCTVCKEKLEMVIEAHGEAVIEREGYPATCTESGLSDEISCSECGKIVQQQKTIKKSGHKYKDENGDSVWAWDEFGHWQECVVCGEAKSVAAHKYKVKDCAEQAECTDKNCDYIKPAGEHLWGKAKVTKKVTCIEDGIQTYTCAAKGCKETYEVIVEAHGEEVIEIDEIPATCTENGKTAKISCSECGKVIQKQKTIKKGHSLTELYFDESGHWYGCDREDCGFTGKVTAHKYADGKCKVCEYEKE